ncbi:hypothetical protein PILCRDRAFT_440621 [Piloderma croceum F 1598]|uniref:Uncharacterized protein n=1 Tax=Piloderma croceum (strain F 1598) TaxID=765440 RepID=A0A0C3C168_PILCF|nr:hypothetical protein PILCRDRAFT_440621 [Piloderma croceum F 1598]
MSKLPFALNRACGGQGRRNVGEKISGIGLNRFLKIRALSFLFLNAVSYPCAISPVRCQSMPILGQSTRSPTPESIRRGEILWTVDVDLLAVLAYLFTETFYLVDASAASSLKSGSSNVIEASKQLPRHDENSRYRLLHILGKKSVFM